MSKIEDGGPAYPGEPLLGEHGMSLRDWFAGQALVGLIGEHSHPSSAGSWGHIDKLASKAFEFADAMIAARKGGGDGE